LTPQGPGLEHILNKPFEQWESPKLPFEKLAFSVKMMEWNRKIAFADEENVKYWKECAKDLSGLPPIFLNVGEHEAMLDGVNGMKFSKSKYQ
jgi:hypothetical protein